MIEPLLSDDALIADIRAAAARRDELHVWWLGQSGFLLQHAGKHALIDPYLSDSLTEKYAQTDKPHTRMTRRVIAPERLDFIDAVSSSHNHTDHLDGQTLRPLFEKNPGMAMIAPEANRVEVLTRMKADVDRVKFLGVDDGSNVTSHGFRFTGIPAAHNTLEKNADGRCIFLGYVIEVGPFTIYHSGDTLLYDGMVERLKKIKIDLALLPINGDRPERRVAGNLDGVQAANLAHEIGAALVVPCHYDQFEFNTASPDGFAQECLRIGQTCRILQAGERLTCAPSK